MYGYGYGYPAYGYGAYAPWPGYSYPRPAYYYPRPVYYGPRYYPYYAPYYAYPPYPVVETAPAAPPVYVERDSGQAAPALPAGYWYYCAESQAYYPSVTQCRSGWEQVAPLPAS